MSNSVNAGDIIREQRQREAAERQKNAVAKLERRMVVHVPGKLSIGFRHPDGGTAPYTCPRTGWTDEQPRLVFIARKLLRLVEGEYEPGREVLVEIPAWLVRKENL